MAALPYNFTGLLPGMPNGTKLGVAEGQVAVTQLPGVITRHMGLSSDTGLRKFLKATMPKAIIRRMPGQPIFYKLVELHAISSHASMADTISMESLLNLMQVRHGCPQAIMQAVEAALKPPAPPPAPAQYMQPIMAAMRLTLGLPQPPAPSRQHAASEAMDTDGDSCDGDLSPQEPHPQAAQVVATTFMVPQQTTWPIEVPATSGVPVHVVDESRYSKILYKEMSVFPKQVKEFQEILKKYRRFNSNLTVAARETTGASLLYIDTDIRSINSYVGFVISHVLRPAGIQPPPPEEWLRLYLNPHYFATFLAFLMERDRGEANFNNHFRSASKAIEWMRLYDDGLKSDRPEQHLLAKMLKEHYAKWCTAMGNHLRAASTTIRRAAGPEKAPQGQAVTMSKEEVRARAEGTICLAAELVEEATFLAQRAEDSPPHRTPQAAWSIQVALLAAMCCGGYIPVQRPGDMLGLTCAGYKGECLRCKHPRCMGNTLYALPGGQGTTGRRYGIALAHHKRGLWVKGPDEQVIIELPHEMNPLVAAMHTWGDEAVRSKHGSTVAACPKMFMLETKAGPISTSYFSTHYKRVTGMEVSPREARQVILTAEVELGVLDKDTKLQLAWEVAAASNTSADQVLRRYDRMAFKDKAEVMCNKLREWRERVLQQQEEAAITE